jgi:pyrimidine operon attenuation protein/uracil phosphoribosyltransferase
MTQPAAPSGVIMDADKIDRAMTRIAHEILERHRDVEDLVLVGIRRRGAVIATRIHELLELLLGHELPLAQIDISPWRDEPERRSGDPTHPDHAIPFDVDGRTIILVDDVLFTGRTIRAAIDAVFERGRPARVQLAVLADRGHRELPIRADYVGKNLPTSRAERVNVHVVEVDGDDAVLIAAPLEMEASR